MSVNIRSFKWFYTNCIKAIICLILLEKVIRLLYLVWTMVINYAWYPSFYHRPSGISQYLKDYMWWFTFLSELQISGYMYRIKTDRTSADTQFINLPWKQLQQQHQNNPRHLSTWNKYCKVSVSYRWFCHSLS